MIRDDPLRQNAWSTWVLRQWHLIRPSPNIAMLYMAVLVGIGAGIGAICFSWLVDSVTDLAFNRGGNSLTCLRSCHRSSMRDFRSRQFLFSREVIQVGLSQRRHGCSGYEQRAHGPQLRKDAVTCGFV